MALSDTRIRTAKPRTKPYKIADERGLFIIINTEKSKWWRLKYRIEGKEKSLSLGVYPDVSLADAREKRDQARKLIADGIDPSATRKATKASKTARGANSFEIIARTWHEKHAVRLAESTAKKNMEVFERDIFPYIGGRPIAEISPLEILETAQRLVDRSAVDSARRVISLCGQVFKYAVIYGKVPSDPTRDIRGAIEAPKAKHFASLIEPKDVAELLRAIDAFKGSYVVMCAIKFAPLVFVRPGELRKAKWADIDLDAAEWKYLVTKTGTDHLVPLSSQAIAILQAIKPLTGHGIYVFPGRDPMKPMSDGTINAALSRMGYDTKTQITGHGFRAMARTILHEILECKPEVIEHQLAHTVPGNLGAAYNRTKFRADRKIMMQIWADYLDGLKSGAKVIQIHSKSS